MARINGSNGNDSINGTRRNDDIRAKKGDDTVNAGDGNDYVDGGAGNDWIDGGAGNDKLKGGAGNDTLIGGAGADQLYGGSGDDVLMGDGPNVYAGGSGSGRRNGSGSGSGSGHGSHHGSGHGGSGSGHVSFNDYLNGGSGNDTVLGQLGDDTLKGGSGNDFLDGGVGRDHVDGDSGDDVGLFVGGENGGRVDWYDGGTGSDTLVISLTSAQFADPDIFADLQALDAFIAANADISTDSGAKQTFSNLGIRVQDWEDLTVLVDGDEVSLELDPLFTEQSDTVDFDDVQAGTYEDGTQYDALGSDDTVTMASSQGEANQAGYDTDVMFNAGAGDDTITGRGLDDKIAGGADDDTISGNDGEDLLIGDNADGGTSETFFATGGAQDWDDAGVTLTAYDFDGDEATVTYDGDGVGVAGGSPVGNQINHSSDGTSEALVATFDSPATEATVTVSRMYATENGGEQGAWQAYDAGGNLVGSGEFGPEITGGGNVGSFTISGIGEFSEIRFSGREYADGTPPGAGDSSDYYVKSIEYTTVDGGEYGDDNIDGGAGDDLIIGDNGDLDCVGHDWHWEHGDTNSSSAGGKIESVDTSIDTASQTVSFTMVVSDTNGNESNGFSLALNDGANPKGLGGELALLYFDASGSEPVLTAYAYNGVNAQTSYFDGSSASGTQAPDPIASSLADPSWVQDISYETDASGDVHTFHFTIDASAINGHDPMYPEAGGWTGLEFGEQLGMWLHPNSDIETAYDSEGFLTEYSTEGHGWLDVSYQQTEQVKAAPDVEGGDDVIDGGEGDDVAYGQGGDDTIVGGVGDDELYGQSGNDIIDGDAPASFVLEDIANNDGCFDISGACDITITADFLSSLAGYDNSFGYYLAGADGNPVSGEIIFADVKNSGPGVGDEVTISLDSDALDGATKLGFFIIPNGENLNPGLADGDDVTFAESGGDWTVISDGSPLAGQGAGVFFSNENLNPGGFDHEEDVAVEGNQNWEDIVNGGDGDHNDVNLNVTVQGNFFRSGIEYDGADASGSGAGSASGHGSGSGHHGHGSGSGSGHHGHGSGSGSASGHHGHGSGSGSGHRGSGSGSASGRNGRGSGSGSGSHGHGSASGSGRGSHRGSGSASGSHHGSHHGSGTGTGAGSVDISFNDYLDGGAGDDILDGNLGADFVYGNVGNDTGKFVVGEYGGLDIYDGGKGTDTLQVYVTSEQFADATIQAELQALQAFIDANSDASTNSGADATFTALDLNVEDWETLEIFVDGKIINDDELVDAIDDSGSVGEDGPGVIIGVLDNDDAPDGVGSVTIVTGPPSGTATVNPDNTITFDPNGDFEYLAEGETTTVTFVYELEDTDGDTDQATVTITITGTNDAPVIGIADNAGAVTEISDGAAGENVDDLTDTGSVAFSDSDLSDTHTVSSVDNGAGYIGSFATVISDPATGDGTGSIDWTFTVNDSLVDHLAVGETIVQSYDVTVDDGNGGTDTETVTITITGTNDAPIIGAGDTSGAVTELPDGDAGENTADLTDTGSLAFTDVDLTDSHTVSSVDNGAGYLGTFGAVINGGDIDWTFTVNDSLLDGLAAGETVVQSYDVTVDDGNGGTDTETVTITITGTNDAPVIDSGDTTGAVTELPDGDAGENTADLTDTGSLAFTDVDLTDAHTVAVAENGAGYVGALTAIVSDDTTGDGTGDIAWTFTVNDAAVDSLAVGEQLVQSYDVTVDDGNGGTDTETVTITITGTNDAPEISGSSDIDGGVTELVDNAPGENVDDLTDSGVIEFADSDLTDGHTVSFVNNGAGYLGTFAAVITDSATGDGSGEVTWDFSVNDSVLEGLSEGEQIVQTYDVTVDDGNGGTDTETVTVTITGANDGPTAEDDVFSVLEDVVLIGNVLDDNGNGADSDPDILDSFSVVETTITTTAGGTVTIAANGAFSYVAPAEHFSGADSFDYTIEDGFGAQDTATATISVIPDADIPDLTVVSPARGNPGTEIPLTIDVVFPDQDGSEEHTILICHVPDGATLNHGIDNEDGSWSLTPAELAGLTITTGVSAPAFESTYDLADLLPVNGGDGSLGFVINGIGSLDPDPDPNTGNGTTGSTTDNTAFDVSNLGDVNGDGIDDFIVSAHLGDANGTNAGEAYVVFGNAAGFDAEFELYDLLASQGGDGSQGFAIFGAEEQDRAGVSVRSAGDVNGDGINDIMVGAPIANADTIDTGTSYVVFGSDTGFAAEFELSSIDGTNGYAINGDPLFITSSNDFTGYAQSGGYDFDGDGSDDLLIGARGNESPTRANDNGSTYLVLGGETNLEASDLADGVQDGQIKANALTIDGVRAFEFEGVARSDQSGFAVSGVNDVNGDGIDDILIGARKADAQSGEAYLVFGGLANLQADDALDGLADGKIDLSLIDGTNGYVFNGINAGDQLGKSISDAGDINGDGVSDFIIGARDSDANGSNSGEAYVVFGGLPNLNDLDLADGTDGQIDVGQLKLGDGSNGFVITAEDAGDAMSRSVRSAGDVNGDGLDDLIIGAPYSDTGNGANTGSSYVVFGRTDGFGNEVDLGDIRSGDGSEGFVIDGLNAQDQSGWAVSGAGDVNNDGIDDLIIGAFAADPHGLNSGEAYVIFGRQGLSTDDFTLTVKATATETDNGDTETSTETIFVDLNEAPNVDDDSTTIDENTPNGTYVITAIGTDPDVGDTLDYAIIGGTGVGVFDINIVTGDITVIDGSALDYESIQSFTLTVEVTDDFGLTDTGVITINLNDVFENSLVDAVDDTGDATEDGPAIIIDVPANDDIPDGLVSITLISQPSEGSASVNLDNTITFDPGSDFQYLAEGETTTVTFVYEAEDTEGDTDQATVTITVTGTNDDPEFGVNVLSGGVTEIADLASGENVDDLTDSGSLIFTDADVSDTHTVSHADNGGGYIGTFSTVVGAGSVDWDFSVNDSLLDSLAVGETIVQSYDVTVDDGNGGTDTETVTITMTGTNDAPVIGAGDTTGGVTEIADGATGENTDNLTDSGSLAFTDVDLTDTHTVSSVDNGVGYIGSFGAIVGAGSVDWTFTVNDSLLDSLNLGDTIVQSYDVTVDDGNGGTDTETVTITMTGTNDAPEITFATGEDEGTVAEDDASNTVSGQLDGNDVDNGATEAWAILGGGTGTYGTLSVDGTGQWTYTLDNGNPLLEDLDTGETATETFTVELQDEHGAFDTQVVTITITGNTDNELVLAVDDTGSVGEDGPAVEIDVLDNDDHPDGFGSVSLISPPSAGVVTLLPNNHFSFDPNGEFDYLADGESTTVTFVYELEDIDGDTDQATVTVTITGTNDDPIIGIADNTGGVTEIADLAAGENVDDLTDTGSIAFSDSDLSDTHTVSSVDNGAGYIGSFATVISDPATGDGTGSIDWTFTVNDSLVDHLAVGETIVQSYDVTVDDGNGGTDTETVTITITGTNDAPIIGAGDTSGAVTELPDGDAGENTADLTDTGSLAFTDVDLTDSHTVSSVDNGAGYLGTFGAVINGGDIDWTFTVNDSLLDGLAAGETVVQSYDVTVDDGNGGTDTETVTITITGTNEAPVITGGDSTGGVTEIVDLASGENIDDLTDSGSLTFTDEDIADTHTVSSVDNGIGYIGSFGAVVGAGSVDWTFTVNDSLVDYLAVGETIVQSYDVTVDDGNGGTDTETVTITITGTNDAPVITGGDTTGGVTEIADGATGENTDNLTDSGSLAFTDVDLIDTHTVSDVDNGAGYIGSFDTVINGSDVDWTFTVNDSLLDGLAAGETIVQSYDVTVDDGNGGTDTETVTITITGTNDAPVIGAGDTTGSVTELPDGDAGENTADLTDTGTLPFTDVDITDTHTVSSVENGAGYLGSFAAVINGSDIDWTFTVNDSVLDGLAAGEQLVQSYDVTVDDGNGGTDTETVTITITGTNEAPVITGGDATGDVTEIADGAPGENVDDLTDSGSLSFSDGDVSDTHTASSVANGIGYVGAFNAVINGGNIDWDFSVNDSLVDHLGDGETIVQSYDVTVDDGNGGTDTETVTITITGTNDAPVITGGDTTGDVTELPDGDAGENTDDLTDSGTLNFADVDLTDSHTVSQSANGVGYLGTFAAVLGAGNTIDWDFSVNDSLLDSLGAGDTLVQSYDVTVDDGNGGTDTETVTITIQGTNDGPVANGDSFGGIEDIPVIGNVLGNDTDVDASDILNVVEPVIISANGGTVTMAPNGDFTYVPFEHFSGADSFTYTVSDGNGGTDTATVDLLVVAVADQPIIVALNAVGATDTAVPVPLTIDFPDEDGSEVHTITLSDVPANATFNNGTDNNDGTWTLTKADLVGLTINVAPPGPIFGSTFDLFDLTTAGGGDGSLGFVLDGSTGQDNNGFDVATAGDVNGDGFADILTSSVGGDSFGRTNSGEVTLYFGGTTHAAETIISATTPAQSYTFAGANAGDRMGTSVRSAGDLNNDGYDDIIIGSPLASPDGNVSGRSYVVFGSAGNANFAAMDADDGTVDGLIDLAQLQAADGGDGSRGFILNGSPVAPATSNEFTGYSTTGGFDFNGDGIDDMAIGATGNDFEDGVNPVALDYGATYLVFGKTTGFAAEIDVQDFMDPSNGAASAGTGDGSEGVVIRGFGVGDATGRQISGMQDMNGDGKDELLIGGRLADPNGGSSGQAYIVYGTDTLGAEFSLGDLDGTNGFIFNGMASNDRMGRSINEAGDINGDGINDIIIGSYRADGINGTDSGEAYVIFGGQTNLAALDALDGTSDGVIETSELATVNGGDGTLGFIISGAEAQDRVGHVVRNAGDLNGDGFDDVLVGAPKANPDGQNDEGGVYVVFGTNTGFAAEIDMGDFAAGDGTVGFEIQGINGGDNAGWSAGAAGDVNGDGFDDIVIGAHYADPNGASSGATYVIFGKQDLSGDDFVITVEATATETSNSDTASSGTGLFVDVDGSDEDTIEGTSYGDTLNGGAGNDTLTGNGGDDLFVFTDGTGDDVITDFTEGAGSEDVIDVSDFGFTDFADLLTATNDSGADTVITLDGDDSLTLIGVQEANLHEDDFLI